VWPAGHRRLRTNAYACRLLNPGLLVVLRFPVRRGLQREYECLCVWVGRESQSNSGGEHEAQGEHMSEHAGRKSRY
jgi:hypothetical protein